MTGESLHESVRIRVGDIDALFTAGLHVLIDGVDGDKVDEWGPLFVAPNFLAAVEDVRGHPLGPGDIAWRPKRPRVHDSLNDLGALIFWDSGQRDQVR